MRSILMFLVLFVAMALNAADVTVDGISYDYSSESTLTVVRGAYSGDVVIPDEVVINGKIYVVTAIGPNAFEHMDITSVNIPPHVTSIGDYAFHWCDNLREIDLPNSVTTIGSSAFFELRHLARVNMGDGVTTLGEYAFANCIELTDLHLSESLTTIGRWAFRSCWMLPAVTMYRPEKSLQIYHSIFQ